MTMTKSIGLLAGAAILAAGLSSAFVHAQDTSGAGGSFQGRGGPGRHMGPGGPGGPFGPAAFGLPPRLMERLNLSDAQREQVKSVVDSHRDEIKALADREFTARKGLQTAVTATAFDESAIRARSAEVAAVDADMAVLRARIHSEVWQVLTPEQQNEAQALQAQMEQRREQARQQRGSRSGRQ